jgi:hypothetical protein
VKYLLMIYSNPENWDHPVFMQTRQALEGPPEEREEMKRGFEAMLHEIRASGEWIAVAALTEPATSRTVKVRDRVALATDGPYVESKEHLAGVFILDCQTGERAEQIAARFPDARFGAVELRPIEGAAGLGAPM